MYKIPEDYKFDELIGSFIPQIAFSANTITLFFEDAGLVTISGGISVIKNNEIIKIDEVYPVTNDHGLLSFIEKKIVNVEINNDRTCLKLNFEGGDSIELLSDEYYEAYTLDISGQEAIV